MLVSNCAGEHVGERIRKLRKSLRLTQIDFGAKVGIVQGHITGIENGKKVSTEKTIKVICAIYGVSEKWLKTGEGDMYAKTDDKKAEKIFHCFNELCSEYQSLVMQQIDTFLEIQNKKRCS
ncbi:MAG: helix-turn-helix domain-containing protein [Chitinispirillales bacterium]|jgi:transcriptional regulator with XRE-family HTH domain|nr:helix-turn-helix domain-containing protein [Chitinispirillales bacterium]